MRKTSVMRAWGAVLFTAMVAAACSGEADKQKKEQEAQAQQLKNLQELAELDRLEMQNDYEDFVRQYGELQMQITNDSLIAQLAEEKKRAEDLLAELKRTKDNDAAEIVRLKKELATLRGILKNYVMQIDSLNRLNQELTNENLNLKRDNQQQRQHVSSLIEEKETLTDKVAIAAQLDANGIVLTAKNKKGKAAKRVKDVKKFQLSFNIARNVTAQTGMKSIYVRILTPTNTVLTQGGTFDYENRTLEYSIRKDIEYTGEDQAVTVYWDVNETLSAGVYRADIFADGHNIGTTTLSIN